MNQKSNVPQSVMDFYLEHKFERSFIERCWQESKGDEFIMDDLIWKGQENTFQQSSSQNDNANQDWFEASQLDKHVSKIMQQVIKKKPREANNFVGIENLESDSIINIMLQLIHQIPQLYEFLLSINSNTSNKSGQFLRCIQLLLTQLTTSNTSLISSKQLLNASFWNQQDQDYLEIEKDPILIFFFLLTKIDQSYRELTNSLLGKNENFFIREFNSIFNTIIMNRQIQEKIYILVTEMKQVSVYSFLYEQYKQKVCALPQILCIQIKRYQNNIKIEQAFDINQVLELGFLKINFQGQQVNETNIYDLEKLQMDIRNFSNTIQMFTEEGTQQDIIKILQSKLHTLETLSMQKFDNIQKQKQALEFSYHDNNTKYAVHSITVQKGQLSNSLILYVYNFKSKKWLKFQNSKCNIVEDEEVTIYSQKHALFVTYINTNLIPQFINHQENLIEIGNIVSANDSYDINQNRNLRNLIPKDILMEAYKINLENKKQFK
ncbi:unnamed protein product [Paramecium primaurelia]|uniref:USP domain-containing protein n=1 Tax=Paramecium primaurelia TaxID=5886 RepID=A0A8S1PS16_PARPR|nr:unnamed protein product [Paramecium primaurelia]